MTTTPEAGPMGQHVMRPSECPHGGYNETIDLTVEPWATLAPLCWNTPSSFRLGMKAEEHGVGQNPFRSTFSQAVFEEGRQCYRKVAAADKRHNAR